MGKKLVDGRAIARDIEEGLSRAFSELSLVENPARLEVLSFGNDPATISFLGIKKRVADRIGVELALHTLPVDTLESVAEDVLISLTDTKAGGVVVQLPLPTHINKPRFLDLIPRELDIDCISSRSLEAFSRGEGLFLSPVALAIEEIFRRYNVELRGKKSALVGYGDLVGKPASFFLKAKAHDYTIFDSTSDLKKLKDFDIIISGVGRPGLITGDVIKQGAVLIDAGTSEARGKLVGDIHESAHEKASLYTPVPGGVGPITVVKLFENLLKAVKHSHNAY